MNMRLLNESKRDDLLLPYVELINQKCNANYSLGLVKKALLKRFQQFGGFSNLSLGSNYYLAGVAKYYFNGDLTTNQDLGIYTDSDDQWNTEVCTRLNALILILRNVIVDSLGEKFEQPEDFGDLPIKKLLRKYGAKIDAALGIVREKKPKEEVGDGLDRNPSVGNGYTYEIMYSFNDCRQFYQYTNPGAWCITYGEQHYNYYVRHLGIHYVIFKQDGFENVPRVEERDKWLNNGGYLPKPQDTFGNSLIALLQSNNNGEPVYITSRWNHGYGTSVEADHAYTKEEFMKITGVTDADLQRIFEIWKKDREKTHRSSRMSSEEAREARELKLKALRALKYDQMRINGGENPAEVFKDHLGNVLPSKVIAGNGKGNKSILDVTVDVEGNKYHVLVDRGNILFETMVSEGDYNNNWSIPTYSYSEATDENGERENRLANRFNNVVLVHLKEHSTMIYNTRLHQFVDIGGLKKFKYIDNMNMYRSSSRGSAADSYYYEIRETNNQIALVDAKTNIPLRLPNGEYWFEDISNNDWKGWQGREVDPKMIKSNKICVITYDSAMNKYFYFIPSEKRFINIDPLNGETEKVSARGASSLEGGFSVLKLGDWHNERYKVYKGETPVSINGVSEFNSIKTFAKRFIIYEPRMNRDERDYYGEYSYCFDCDTQSLIGFNGNPIKFRSAETVGYEGWRDEGKLPTNYIIFYISDNINDNGQRHRAMIYSIRDNAFLLNPENGRVKFDIANNHGPNYETDNKLFQIYSDRAPLNQWGGRDYKTLNADEIRDSGKMVNAEIPARVTPENADIRMDDATAEINEGIIPIGTTDIERMVNEAVIKILKNIL